MSTEHDIGPLGLRVLARCVDFGVQVGIMELAFGGSAFLPSQGLLTLSDTVLVAVDIGVGLSALLVYLAASEALGGATFGKFITNLRVVDERGEPIGLRAAIVRNLALPVDLFVFGLVAYSAIARSESQQRVGDHWAGTIVIRRATFPWTTGLRGWPVAIVVSATLVLLSYAVAK